jgi:hypothetical protein
MSTHAPVGGPAMKPTPALIILMIASLLAPSARSADRFPTRDQLNDPGRGVWSDDTADVLKPRQLIYEAKEDGRYRVSYNLIREVGGDVKGYFARLTIRNLSENTVVAATDVTLIDAESSVISATDRDTFRALAATLADTKAPAATLKAAQSSPANDDIFQAFLRGQSEGAVVKVADDAALGRKMAVWADSFWLKPTLELPPHGQVSGVRVFLAQPYHPLPLSMRVKVGDSEFEFTTRAK